MLLPSEGSCHNLTYQAQTLSPPSQQANQQTPDICRHHMHSSQPHTQTPGRGIPLGSARPHQDQATPLAAPYLQVLSPPSHACHSHHWSSCRFALRAPSLLLHMSSFATCQSSALIIAVCRRAVPVTALLIWLNTSRVLSASNHVCVASVEAGSSCSPLACCSLDKMAGNIWVQQWMQTAHSSQQVCPCRKCVNEPTGQHFHCQLPAQATAGASSRAGTAKGTHPSAPASY